MTDSEHYSLHGINPKPGSKTDIIGLQEVKMGELEELPHAYRRQLYPIESLYPYGFISTCRSDLQTVEYRYTCQSVMTEFRNLTVQSSTR